MLIRRYHLIDVHADYWSPFIYAFVAAFGGIQEGRQHALPDPYKYGTSWSTPGFQLLYTMPPTAHAPTYAWIFLSDPGKELWWTLNCPAEIPYESVTPIEWNQLFRAAGFPLRSQDPATGGSHASQPSHP